MCLAINKTAVLLIGLFSSSLLQKYIVIYMCVSFKLLLILASAEDYLGIYVCKVNIWDNQIIESVEIIVVYKKLFTRQ